jgi:hypothetical protein
VILLCVFAIFASLREKPHLVLILIFTFSVRLRHGLAGHTILALDPFAEIYKLAAFRTEGTDRIVFPLDWLTAGWTLHES